MRMDRELSNISIIDDYHKELKNELQQRESISFNTFLTKVINDKRTSSMLFLEKKDQFTYVIDKLLSSFKKDHNIEYQEYWLITNKQQDAKYYKNKFLTEIKDPSSIVEWKIITILDVPAFKAFLSFLNLYLISHKCPTLIVIDDLSVFRKMSEGTKAVFELINLIVLSVSQLSIESKR
ncbi:hypothetical protein K502DRAFT_171069 [Neoconidiobolus thromboides FSU 785]|nr:hypothetical protein K502DRAFT_171069 [Neoconidiobolus thromboides FSU 785]